MEVFGIVGSIDLRYSLAVVDNCRENTGNWRLRGLVLEDTQAQELAENLTRTIFVLLMMQKGGTLRE